MRSAFLRALKRARSYASLKPATKFCDQLRGTTRERADLRAGLTVTDGTCPVGDVNRDEIRGILALRAVARLTIHGRALNG